MGERMKVIPIDKLQPVLVTGATGYVAGWIVKRLLDAGVTVHAAVREPRREDKVAHLKALAADAPGKLHLFAADLLQDGSYAAAMAGCGIVFHTASPFTSQFADPQKDLVDPAVQGTRNVLDEAKRSDSVRRVVLTSSCAAIYCDAIDCARAPGGRLDETVWNTTASLDYQPYSYSKTAAERSAWDIARAQSRWQLVVLNPSLVVGPALQARPTSESFRIVQSMGDGTLRMGAPRVGFGAVDVRDLADAHLAAAFLPHASGRNIVSAHETDLLAMARTLLPRFGKAYPIPRRAMPKWKTWLFGPLLDRTITRRFVTRNVDVPWRADNSKAIRELGLAYRPLEQSMQDMFEQMIGSGMLPQRRPLQDPRRVT